MEGVFPLAEGLDSIGFIGRTVDDVAFVDEVLSRGAAPDASTTLSGLRILVPDEVVVDQLDPAVASAFEQSLSRLRETGVRVDRIAVPEIAQMFALQANYGSLVGVEAYRLHRHRLGRGMTELDPRVAKRLLQSAGVSELDYRHVRRGRRSLIAKAKAYFSAGAVIACPTVACTAPLMQPLLDDDAQYYAANGRVLRNTMVANFLDWCSVTLPCGCDKNGLAIGFMIARENGEDLALLRAARLVEGVISDVPWKQ
jgi:aspartyl-tRNA(Asn)/glutamyl-tRNA(Gln) amidotransferase subunit A